MTTQQWFELPTNWDNLSPDQKALVYCSEPNLEKLDPELQARLWPATRNKYISKQDPREDLGTIDLRKQFKQSYDNGPSDQAVEYYFNK